jgi:hypothetical protein
MSSEPPEIATHMSDTVGQGGARFASIRDLAGALRRAAAAHEGHEKRLGAADPEWPDWYAAFLVAEQSGAQAPS